MSFKYISNNRSLKLHFCSYIIYKHTALATYYRNFEPMLLLTLAVTYEVCIAWQRYFVYCFMLKRLCSVVETEVLEKWVNL